MDFLRLISLNFSITTVNFIVITFLIISLFSFINILFFSWKTFFNKKLLFLILLFIFFLINNIQIDGHHLSGDSFYHYGYKTLIINFLKLDFIPIIGGHYFEPLLVTPITFILQDFFFLTHLNNLCSYLIGFFKRMQKHHLFLLYLSCKYFYNNEKIFVPIILVLLLFLLIIQVTFYLILCFMIAGSFSTFITWLQGYRFIKFCFYYNFCF